MFAALVSPLVSLCLIAPVAGPITEPFVAPACPYCSGNRAVDFRTRVDELVQVPVGGVVHFTGRVGGRVYVTIRAGGRLVTVGGIGEVTAGLTRGSRVRQGRPLGRAIGPEDSVSLSVRDASGLHLDPTPFLGRRVPIGPRSRLVPLDGTFRRPAPRAVCRLGG